MSIMAHCFVYFLFIVPFSFSDVVHHQYQQQAIFQQITWEIKQFLWDSQDISQVHLQPTFHHHHHHHNHLNHIYTLHLHAQCLSLHIWFLSIQWMNIMWVTWWVAATTSNITTWTMLRVQAVVSQVTLA